MERLKAATFGLTVTGWMACDISSVSWSRALLAAMEGRATSPAEVSTPLNTDPSSCPSNPIVAENMIAGDAQWDLSGLGDTTIEGFTTRMSVNRGETVFFKITSDRQYHLEIYRIGYYGNCGGSDAGCGARFVTRLPSDGGSFPALVQPSCASQFVADGGLSLVDCGNWGRSASWDTGANISGVYFAKLVKDSADGQNFILFVVRDDAGCSDILFQTSDTTWLAYNDYAQRSFYPQELPDGGLGPNAYKVSYNRPLRKSARYFFVSEYPMIRWLERNGYNVSYFTGADADSPDAGIVGHTVFLSVGHDEYWSKGQRDNVEAALDAGVSLAFFSGNIVYWKTRWEPSTVELADHRTLVCYKDTEAGQRIDPVEPTGTWRDLRFDGGRPENQLTGTLFKVVNENPPGAYAMKVPAAYGQMMRFWRDTSIYQLQGSQSATIDFGSVCKCAVGFEWDEDSDNGFRPDGIVRLSKTVNDVQFYLQDYGLVYGFQSDAGHYLTLYKKRPAPRALVFSAGSILWSWGLDNVHDDYDGIVTGEADQRVKQATVNLFADMGAQRDTIEGGLRRAIPSTDELSPISTIVSPDGGDHVGRSVQITGTAIDRGGGRVGGVEVFSSGEGVWHPAITSWVNPQMSWSYSWQLDAGQVTLRVRSVDDSGNIEDPPQSVTVTVDP